MLLEPDQERQVGVPLDVVDKERRPLVDQELGQDDVAHRHRHRAVGARRARHPLVGELGVVRVVGADRDDLRSPVTDLGHPVRVRGAGDRHVGAPHHQVRGVPPVTGFRHVGLVAEHLRGGHRQVGVPVVERRHRAAHQFDEPRPGGVRHHRHRRDRREPGDPVRPVPGDGVHVRGGGDLGGLVPADPDQARPCRGPAGSAGGAPGRPGSPPRPAPDRRAGPWPPGTSRSARRARRGSGPGSGSRCTRRTPRPAGSRVVRSRVGPDPTVG